MKIFKSIFLVLPLLFNVISLNSETVFAAENPICKTKADRIETAQFQFFEELTYEEYVTAIAEENKISYSEVENDLISSHDHINLQTTKAYETRYGRFYNLYNYSTGAVMTSVNAYTVRCGIYATYEVDSSNWQLRQFTNINSTYIEPGTSGMTIDRVNSLYANITGSTSVFYHVNAQITGLYNGTALFTKDINFYL